MCIAHRPCEDRSKFVRDARIRTYGYVCLLLDALTPMTACSASVLASYAVYESIMSEAFADPFPLSEGRLTGVKVDDPCGSAIDGSFDFDRPFCSSRHGTRGW